MKTTRRTPRAIRRASKGTLRNAILMLRADAQTAVYIQDESLENVLRACVRLLNKEIKRREKKGWTRSR
jgi:hypothetical protein